MYSDLNGTLVGRSQDSIICFSHQNSISQSLTQINAKIYHFVDTLKEITLLSVTYNMQSRFYTLCLHLKIVEFFLPQSFEPAPPPTAYGPGW